jgi:hypothetical protein
MLPPVQTAEGQVTPPHDVCDPSTPAMEARCTHPMDRIVVAKLAAAGFAPRDSDNAELCRRAAIDLVGRVPTDDDRRACAGATPAAIAEHFLASDDYPRIQARRLFEQLRLFRTILWPPYTQTLDALLREAYRGGLSYGAFANQLVVHPAWLAQNFDWPESVFTFALGRPPREEETNALITLGRALTARLFCVGSAWYAEYKAERRAGKPEADATAAADKNCPITNEAGLDLCSCSTAGVEGCRTDVAGATVDFADGFDTSTCAPGAPDPEGFLRTWTSNAHRIAELHPEGAVSTMCEDGVARDGCATREHLFDPKSMTFVLRPLKPWPDARPADRARLLSLPRALMTRSEFWEAAADRELVHFLGWWKNGFREPSVEIPEVRTALADALRGGASLRDVQKMIVTSVLYTAPSSPPPESQVASRDAMRSGAPPWAMGPTKLLAGEDWLDSVGVATGETLGACDVRYLDLPHMPGDVVARDDGYDPRVLPGMLFTRTPTLHAGGWTGTKYLDVARQLGGCNLGGTRATYSSVAIASTQHRVAALACAAGRGVLPAGFDAHDASDAALAAAASQVHERTLGRAPTADKLTTLVGEMRACMKADAGCAGPEQAVRWLCQRLVDSAQFALY